MPSHYVYTPKQRYERRFKKGGAYAYTTGGEYDPIMTELANKQATYERLREQTLAKRFGIKTEAEQYGEQRLKAIREKAEIDAQMLEKRYTREQILRIEQLKTTAQHIENSNDFTPEQKTIALRELELQEMGIRPEMRARLSKFPKGRDIGDMWEQNGILMSRKENGEAWQVDYGKTERGHMAKQEAEAIKEKAKLDQEMQKEKNKYIDSLTKIQVPDENNEGAKRYLTPAEMKERMDVRYPSTPLPTADEVQQARDYIMTMLDRWGNNPPPEVQAAIQEAASVIQTFNERAW